MLFAASIATMLILPVTQAHAGVFISVNVAPPVLPVYVQPPLPAPGYIWTPGYWAYGDAGYYWVPGVWVQPPSAGLLWTPGYWGWGGGFYAWHPGYWGPHIGFYGGINYGFGYGGVGFVGGYWRGGAFYYNRSVTNVSVTNVTNVYNRTVVVNNTRTTSFNGGEGGIEARPTAQEEAAAHETHTAALPSQAQHEQAASQNRQNFASENHGRPAVAATSRPGDFSSHSAVPARSAGGEYKAPAMSPKEARVSTPSANAAGNKGGSNEGFRSFTPPSKNSASTSNNRTEGNTGSNAGRGSENRPSEARPVSESHPAPQPKASAPKENAHKSSPPPKRQNAPKEPRRR